jgi:hypothetical protein
MKKTNTKDVSTKNKSNIPMVWSVIPKGETCKGFSPLTFTLTAIGSREKKDAGAERTGLWTKTYMATLKDSAGEIRRDANKKALKEERETKHYGINAVFSGFNGAFKQLFPDLDPVKCTTQLAEHGVIDIRPVAGSVILYHKGEMQSGNNQGDIALATILGEEKIELS